MSEPHPSIRLAGVPEHFNYGWHLAEQRGAFAKAGLNLQWQDAPGGTGAMARALENCEIDAAIMLSEGSVAAITNGLPARLVATVVASPLTWGIHVHDKSTITTIEQIRAKRIAISRRGSGSHLMAVVDADQRGWPVDRLQLVEVGSLDGARQALASSRADVFFWEKYTTKPLVDAGEWRRVGERPTPWPCFMLVARQGFLEEAEPHLHRALQIVVAETRRLDESATILRIAEQYALDPADVREWHEQTRWSYEPTIGERALSVIIEALHKLGLIAERPRPEALIAAETILG